MTISAKLPGSVRATSDAIAAPTHRKIVVCDANPVLAVCMQQLLQNNPVLAPFSIMRHQPDDLPGLRALMPDILIIDPWQCPGQRHAVLTELAAFPQSTSMICYCTEIIDTDAYELDSFGFAGIMPKTIDSNELIRIVCAVAFGGTFTHENMAKRQVCDTASVAVPSDGLSERELAVLRYVALGRSMKEIAIDLNVSTKTVDTYKSRAFQKLNLRTRSDAVRHAIQSGWMR